MAPVIAAIAWVVMNLAPIIGATLTAAQASAIAFNILLVAAMVAISFLVNGKPRGIDQGTELSLKFDPTQPRQVIVGRAATGGSIVYAFTWTDDTSAPNKYLVRVIALSDYPITEVFQIFDGIQYLTYGTNDRAHYYSQSSAPSSGLVSGDLWQNTSSVPYTWAIWNGSAWVATGAQTPSITAGAIYSGMTACDQYRSKSGAARAWIRIHKGVFSGAVADTYLTAHAPSSEWDTTCKGTGMAYAVVAWQYDTDAFPNGEPQLQFFIDGAACYDDRFSVANGGSQVLGTPSTYNYSQNSAVIAAQYLRGFSINGVTICGSQADSRDLIAGVVTNAANICDTLVSAPGSTTEVQYKCGLMLSSANTVQQDLQAIVNSMDGLLYDRGGYITLLPGAAYTPTLSITDADVVWSEAKSWQPQAGLSDLYNSVTGSYVPSAQRYTAAAYPVQKSSTYITQDGGFRLNLQYDLPAVNSDTQVQRITSAALSRSRFQGTVSFVMPLWGLQLEQGDWFTFTSTRWGFSSYTFQVAQISITEDMKVSIIGKQTSSTINSWNPATQYISPTLGISAQSRGFSLATPTLTLTASSQTNGSGTTYPIIICTAAVGAGAPAQYFEFQMRLTSTPATVWSLQSLPAALGSATMNISSNILNNTSYDIQTRVNDGLGRSSAWSSWSTITTTTNLTVPGSVGTGNRIPLSQFESGSSYWSGASSSSAAITSFSESVINNLATLQIAGTVSATGQYLGTTSLTFPVTGGENVYIGGVITASTNGAMYLNCFNASGAFTGQCAVTNWTGVQSNAQIQGSGLVPAGSVVAYWVGILLPPGSSGSYTLNIAQPMLQGISLGQTVFPAFNAGPTSKPGSDPNSLITISAGAISGIGSGSGTVIANSLVAAGTGNRVILSQAEKGTTGWQFGSISGAPSPSIAQQTSTGLTGIQCAFTATASAQSANIIGATAYRFAVTAGEYIACSALFNTTPLATASFNIEYYNSSGSFLSDASIGSSVPTTSTLALRQAILQVPTSAVTAAVWFSTNSTGAGVAGAAMYQPMVQGIPAGQTTYPAFTPGPNSSPGSDPNSLITISSGAISGIGSGSGTVVANSAIIIAAGILTGAGTAGITVDNTFVPVGQNAAVNSELSSIVSSYSATYPVGWTSGWGGDSTGSVTTSDTRIQLADNTYAFQRTMTGSTNGSCFDVLNTSQTMPYSVPCVPGQIMGASALAAFHNCNSAAIYILFYNAAGGQVTAFFSSTGGYNNSSGTYTALSRTSLGYLSVVGVVPATAVRCVMALRCNISGSPSSPSGIIAAPFLGVLSSTNQVVPSYTPGPADPNSTYGAIWNSSLSGAPGNLTGLSGSEAIQNSSISISGGALNGIGSGSGTTVANSAITISSGALNGIGSGSGTVVDNSLVTASGIGAVKTDASNAPSSILNSNIAISSSGVLSGAGGGSVSLSGLGAGALATVTPPTYAGMVAAITAGLTNGMTFLDSTNSSKLTSVVSSVGPPKYATATGTGNITTSGNSSCHCSFTGLTANGIWSFSGQWWVPSASTPYSGITSGGGTWSLVETGSSAAHAIFTGTWSSSTYNSGLGGINFYPDTTYSNLLYMSGAGVVSTQSGSVTVTLWIYDNAGVVASVTNGISMSVVWTPTQ